MKLVAGWAVRTVAAVAVVLAAGQVPALAAPPVGGGGGGDGGGGSDNPPACLTNATASLHVSWPNVFAGQGVVVSWSGRVPSGCTVGRTITGPGFDPTEALPVSGSRTIATPTPGTLSWSLTLWATPWSLPNSAHTSVAVLALPQSPGVAALTQNDGRLDVFESSYVAPVDQAAVAQQRAPGDGFDLGNMGIDQLRSVTAGVNGYWNPGQAQWFGLDANGQVYTGMQAAPGGPGWLTAGLFDPDGRPGLTSLAVANNNDGRLQVFGTDWFGNVVTRWQLRTGGWSGWGQFDGFVRRLAAARQADGRIVLLGVNIDNNVYEKVQSTADGGWPAGWTLLPMTGTSVAVTGNADGRLEMFVADPSGGIRSFVQDTTNATTWTQRGSGAGVGDQIAVATNADGRIEIISHDATGAVVHAAQVTPGSATWTGWVPLDRAAPTGPVTCTGFAVCSSHDVDGDGRPDAIGFVQSARTDTTQNDVWVALADRFHPGSYHPAQRWSDQFCPAPMTCTAGHLHADNRLDLVAFDHSNGDVWVSRPNADGTAYLPPERWTGPNTCHGNDICGVADIDGDHLDDIIARDPADTTLGDGQVWTAPNTGSGFGPRTVATLPADASLPRTRPQFGSCQAMGIAADNAKAVSDVLEAVAGLLPEPAKTAMQNLANTYFQKAISLLDSINAGHCN